MAASTVLFFAPGGRPLRLGTWILTGCFAGLGRLFAVTAPCFAISFGRPLSFWGGGTASAT